MSLENSRNNYQQKLNDFLAAKEEYRDAQKEAFLENCTLAIGDRVTCKSAIPKIGTDTLELFDFRFDEADELIGFNGHLVKKNGEASKMVRIVRANEIDKYTKI